MIRRPPRSPLFPYPTLFRSPQNARRMYGAARSPLKRLLIIPGAEHNNTYRVNAQLYEAEVLAFLHTVLVADTAARSEEHTSELQSQSNLVCRLLLEKKKIDT